MSSLLLGPLLGYEKDSVYTVCFLTKKGVSCAEICINGKKEAANFIKETVYGFFWRYETKIEPKDYEQSFEYFILIDGKRALDSSKCFDLWRFYVPSLKEEPSIVYATCNGFSSSALKNSTPDIYALWRRMDDIHNKKHFHLMLMGGDQIYADELWDSHKLPTIKEWLELPMNERLVRRDTKKMNRELEAFYENLYITKWKAPNMSLMFASIPSAMMWDDHDIFDGWGSYPDEIQNSRVYKAIFRAARKYFELFQIRTLNNRSLFRKDRDHYSFCFEFCRYLVIGLDQRTNRKIDRVMNSNQWKEFIDILKNSDKKKTLLVMAGLPLVYRDFSFSEHLVDMTPWNEELTDDIKDQWRAKGHQGERLRMIMWLLKAQRERFDYNAKTVVLSGDVHIGALGVVNDKKNVYPIYKVHQVISSGIVHPPPTPIQWLGIKTITNDDTEYLNEEKSIEALMLKPVGSAKYLRTRNFSYMQWGSDDKLWVNWICEWGNDAEYPLE